MLNNNIEKSLKEIDAICYLCVFFGGGVTGFLLGLMFAAFVIYP